MIFIFLVPRVNHQRMTQGVSGKTGIGYNGANYDLLRSQGRTHGACYLWVQPWDRNKWFLVPVRTYDIIVHRTDNLCISLKIKNTRPLEV